MTVGDRIRRKRLELGLSQEELAFKLGYKSRSSVNKIECARNLPLSKVEKMATVLGCTPSFLFGWEDENGKQKEVHEIYCLDSDVKEIVQFLFKNPEHKALFDALRKLSAEDIAIVKTVVDRFGSNQ